MPLLFDQKPVVDNENKNNNSFSYDDSKICTGTSPTTDKVITLLCHERGYDVLFTDHFTTIIKF